MSDEEVVARQVTTIANIKRAVADYYDITIEELESRRRVRKYSRPRMVAMYLARDMTAFSYPQLGEKFDRDHTTVLHAVEFVGNEISLYNDLEELRRKLNKKGYLYPLDR